MKSDVDVSYQSREHGVHQETVWVVQLVLLLIHFLLPSGPDAKVEFQLAEHTLMESWKFTKFNIEFFSRSSIKIAAAIMKPPGHQLPENPKTSCANQTLAPRQSNISTWILRRHRRHIGGSSPHKFICYKRWPAQIITHYLQPLGSSEIEMGWNGRVEAFGASVTITRLYWLAGCHQAKSHVTKDACSHSPPPPSWCSSCCHHVAPALCFCLNLCPTTSAWLSAECESAGCSSSSELWQLQRNVESCLLHLVESKPFQHHSNPSGFSCFVGFFGQIIFKNVQVLINLLT